MRVLFLANAEATEAMRLKSGAENQFRNHGLNFESCHEYPDAIVFLTGGTETFAVSHLRNGCALIPLGTANGLASALEVRAWAKVKGITAPLVSNIFENSAVCATWKALSTLRKQRVGILGTPSDWLVKSRSDAALHEIGCETISLPLSSVHIDTKPNKELLEKFDSKPRTQRVNTASIQSALQLHQGLSNLIAQENLNAITIRCFDFVKDHGVSACLSLGILNADGVVAGCEGDLEALASLLLARAITNQPAFMANITRYEEGVATFAHCTADVTLARNLTLDTHFESGKSVAIRAQILSDAFTVFRVGQGKLLTVYEGEGVRLSHNENMCRTQLSLRLPESLLENALGNHHIVIPGRWAKHLSALTSFGWSLVGSSFA